MSDGNPAQTFIHMCFALAGAGIVMWGAQQVCDDKMDYAKCIASGKVSATNTKEKIAAACAAKHDPTNGKGTKKSMYIMYGGFGIIAGSVLILWILNSFFGQGGGYSQYR